jgi:hypothetical protein
MALKGKAGIRLRHSFSIIYHLDRSTTSVYYQDLDSMSSGIHRILHQFLNHRGRTLYDLTCRNLIRDRVG